MGSEACGFLPHIIAVVRIIHRFHLIDLTLMVYQNMVWILCLL